MKSLIEASFNVTIVRRPTSAPASDSLPTTATYKTADYDSVLSLTEAFSGLDAIVESFNPIAAAFQSAYFYIEASFFINISAFKAQCHFLHAF